MSPEISYPCLHFSIFDLNSAISIFGMKNMVQEIALGVQSKLKPFVTRSKHQERPGIFFKKLRIFYQLVIDTICKSVPLTCIFWLTGENGLSKQSHRGLMGVEYDNKGEMNSAELGTGPTGFATRISSESTVTCLQANDRFFLGFPGITFFRLVLQKSRGPRVCAPSNSAPSATNRNSLAPIIKIWEHFEKKEYPNLPPVQKVKKHLPTCRQDT